MICEVRQHAIVMKCVIRRLKDPCPCRYYSSHPLRQWRVYNIEGVQAAAAMEAEKVAAEGGRRGAEVVDTRYAIAAKKTPQVISKGEQMLSELRI